MKIQQLYALPAEHGTEFRRVLAHIQNDEDWAKKQVTIVEVGNAFHKDLQDFLDGFRAGKVNQKLITELPKAAAPRIEMFRPHLVDGTHHLIYVGGVTELNKTLAELHDHFNKPIPELSFFKRKDSIDVPTKPFFPERIPLVTDKTVVWNRETKTIQEI